MSKDSRAKRITQGIAAAVLIVIVGGLVFIHFSPGYNMYISTVEVVI